MQSEVLAKFCLLDEQPRVTLEQRLNGLVNANYIATQLHWSPNPMDDSLGVRDIRRMLINRFHERKGPKGIEILLYAKTFPNISVKIN